MPVKRLFLLFLSVSLGACSSFDGLYAPACTAYEGSEIRLADGRYTWRKFTDERRLDEHGRPVEAAADSSTAGHYNVEDSVVFLVPDGGQSTISFYLYDNAQGQYLLTSAENGQYRRDGSMPECALRRMGPNTP